MDKVVFLDRDGTINEEVNYLYKPEDFQFLPGVPQALKMLTDAGFKLIVVTNQAGVARGYYTEEDVKNLHAYVNRLLEPCGTGIDGFYYCPHHPEYGLGRYKRNCRCRKPDIGLFLQAEADRPVDKGHSYMIGDKLLDIQAGRRYGVTSILVGTGYGTELRRQAAEDLQTVGAAGPGCSGGADGPGVPGGSGASPPPPYDHFAETLLEAARWILQREGEIPHE